MHLSFLSSLGLFLKSNNTVITNKKISIYNVITSWLKHPQQNGYNKVITYYKKSNYIVILLTGLSVCGLNVRAHAVELKTPITQGTLVYGRAAKGERVFLQQTELKQDKEGLFVLGLPQDTEEVLFLTTKKAGITKIWSLPIEKRTWKEEVVNGLPPQKVSPSKADEERIARENALIKEGRAETSYITLPVCFTRPVAENARISSTFGSRRILNGGKTAGHSGTDYALPTGAPIVTPTDGMVKVAANDMFLSGKTVLIDHGFGIFSSYSHLSSFSVKAGQFLKQGDKIGEVGMTGRSTGPHLHLTLTWFGIRVDPEFVLQKYGCQK